MECGETIGMCISEAYCTECGNKEYFNGCKPFDTPKVCFKCGGKMTTKELAKFLKQINENYSETGSK